MQYICFLRAINVGGRTVKMERLRALLSDAGLQEVRTYIQSGNVFFISDEKAGPLERKIEGLLRKALGYEVPAMVRTVAQVEAALAGGHFKDVEVTPNTRQFIIFISQALPEDETFPQESPKGDVRLLGTTEGEVFVHVTQEEGRAVNAAAYIEKRFKVAATARFFGTTQKILEAAKASA